MADMPILRPTSTGWC